MLDGIFHTRKTIELQGDDLKEVAINHISNTLKINIPVDVNFRYYVDIDGVEYDIDQICIVWEEK